MKQDDLDREESYKQEDSRSWTSYSDLFVTISVIFLVMFVFALVRSSIAAFTQAKSHQETKQYLLGNVSEKKQKKIEKQRKELSENIEKIASFNKKVEESQKDLDSLVKELTRREIVVKSLLAEQREREGLIHHLKEQLENKKKSLKEQESKSKKIEAQSKVLAKKAAKESTQLSQKLEKLEKEKEALSNKVQSQGKTLKSKELKVKTAVGKEREKLQKVISQLKGDLRKVEKEKAQKSKEHSELVKVKNHEIQVREKEIRKVEKQAQAKAASNDSAMQKAKKDHAAELAKWKQKFVATLKQKTSELKSQHTKELEALRQGAKKTSQQSLKDLETLKKQYEARMKASQKSSREALDSLKKQHAREVKARESALAKAKSGFQKELKAVAKKSSEDLARLKREKSAGEASFEKELEGLKKDHMGKMAGLEKSLGQVKKERAKLQGQVNGLKKKATQNQKDWSAKNDRLQSENLALNKANKTLTGKQDKMASLGQDLAQKHHECEIDKQSGVRQLAAHRIANTMRAVAGKDVKVDAKTGNLVLQLGQTFFEKDSAEITKDAKKILDAVIPGYARELMKNDEVWREISDISIVGHASPRYNGQAVSPEEKDTVGYRYNKFLSRKRAKAITEYIKKMIMKDVPKANQFFGKMKYQGKGYEQPIRLKRGVASQDDKGCGVYSCLESRRVEIVFKLHNVPETMNFKERAK